MGWMTFFNHKQQFLLFVKNGTVNQPHSVSHQWHRHAYSREVGPGNEFSRYSTSLATATKQ